MTTTITYTVGDVRDVMASMPDGSVHLVVTSPPFLALRSYLPADHADKHREIGSEATPAGFIDTMLGLTADWRRLLAEWGSIAVEIGDTYAGSGGAGGDYAADGLRDGQPKFKGSGWADAPRPHYDVGHTYRKTDDDPSLPRAPRGGGRGWPQSKSLCGIPTLYTWSLAYGRNLLTGDPSPAGDWRVRNLLTWTRPNPPVGALGDKFRPGTSFVTVACTSPRRWFDLDAVRTGLTEPGRRFDQGDKRETLQPHRIGMPMSQNPGGAPPLDWWDANDCDDDQLAEHWQPLHRLTTQPYAGSHYATYPVALPQRLIEAMCPREVCAVCGEPRRRISERGARVNVVGRVDQSVWNPDLSKKHDADHVGSRWEHLVRDGFVPGHSYERTTLGWTDCEHDAYTPGVVLDPFGGSGTTAVAAARAGRDAVLIDLDARNVDLARRRIGELLRIVDERTDGAVTTWTVEAPLPAQRAQIDGQTNLFDLMEGTA